MLEITFIILCGIYFLISRKVTYWTTITALGFRTCAPVLFGSFPLIYYLVSYSLLLTSFILLFFLERIPWYVSIIVLIVTSFLSIILGNKNAIKEYRKQFEYDPDDPYLDEDTKKGYDECLSKTDQEIIQFAIKYGRNI
jgi:hypothetical protein